MKNTTTNETANVAHALPSGAWGGNHIGLEVTKDGAHLDYDCAHGTITQPLEPDRSGHFDVKGFHVKEHGGPVREDEHGNGGEPARYIGQITDKTMTLTVTLKETKENVGTFSLTQGQAPRIRKCL